MQQLGKDTYNMHKLVSRRTSGSKLTQVQYSHSQLNYARQETQKHRVVEVSALYLLVRHEGQQRRRPQGDVFARTKYRVDETSHKR